MRLLKGKMYLTKIDRTRVKRDDDGRGYLDVVVCLNDIVERSGKAGVLQQNTQSGEDRIYLANLYVVHKNYSVSEDEFDGL